MSKKIPMSNKKYNLLLVKEEFKDKDNRWKVKCLCDCGEECVVLRSHVLASQTKSCGCLNKLAGSANKNWQGHGGISRDYWTSLERGAKKRGFVFDVSIEEAWSLYLKQDGKCAISGEKIDFVTNRKRENCHHQTASLDRINSDIGYLKGNIQWVHKVVNRIKSDLQDVDLIAWARKISDYQITGNDYAKWDKRFLALAKNISTWSKDGSTQVGAVIADAEHRIISMGYNGLAKCLSDEFVNLDRDRKLKTIIHAEINAILFAQRNLAGCTLYTWPIMPCSNCSSTIIQVGISRCVFPKADGDRAARWADSFSLARRQFEEAGVVLQEYEEI